ncbi:TonB-dependent receptor [Sphingomonas qilianensis]|uniref:TonB-dependent receptor n=1 Tax=Sphingomonas qilianensis TaxID=1736690 RepID=A0ABU9XUV3_9SPHN
MIRFIATAAALLASTSVYAQVAPATPAAAPPAANSVVQNDDADQVDIIVTAQKREQSLQDVSAAVTAISSDRLATAQVSTLQDLQNIIPSVNFGSDFNQAKIFIRGVGANTSTTGSSTGVAFHVDGAYVARAEAQLTSLFDLERVEVLRGPQGTLYGRNAVGGSINLITAKPTDDLSGYARATYGNYNAIIAEAAIGGAIIDGVRARVAVRSEDRDGFGRNPVTGRDVDDLNRRMIRGQLAFDLGPKVDLLLSGEYFRQNDSSGAIHYLRASFPGVARLAPLGVGGYATRARDLASESQVGTDTKTYAFTGTLTAALTDTLSVTNITNYRNFKSSLFQDLDLSAVISSLATNGQATTNQERRIDSKQFSNELQFNYQSNIGSVVLGAYYFHERQRPIDNVGLAARNGQFSNIAVLQAAGIDLNEAYGLCGYGPGTLTGGAIIAPKRVCTRSNLGTRAFALFGQANIKLGDLVGLDGLSLKLGGRYSNEKATSENPSIVITRNGLGPVLRYTAAQTHRERTFKDFTPEAGLEWKLNPDVLIYYTYSEGFKAGSGENASGSTTIVDPETIKNNEAGIKATVMRGLTVNLSAYAYTLRNLQLNKTITGGPTGYTTIFQNAASTKAKGLELEVFARPTRGVRLSGALSYTDAHFTDYLTLDPLNPANVASAGAPGYNPITNPDPTAFGAPGGGNIQLSGNDVRNSPRLSWNVHGEFDLSDGNSFLNGQLTPSFDISHKSRTYFSEFERDIESARAYTMVDGTLTYRTATRNIRVEAFVKNAFDIFRPSSTFALGTGRLIGVTYLPPRTYGLSIGYDF